MLDGGKDLMTHGPNSILLQLTVLLAQIEDAMCLNLDPFTLVLLILLHQSYQDRHIHESISALPLTRTYDALTLRTPYIQIIIALSTSPSSPR